MMSELVRLSNLLKVTWLEKCELDLQNDWTVVNCIYCELEYCRSGKNQVFYVHSQHDH